MDWLGQLFALRPAVFVELLADMEPVAVAGLFQDWKECEPKHSGELDTSSVIGPPSGNLVPKKTKCQTEPR